MRQQLNPTPRQRPDPHFRPIEMEIPRRMTSARFVNDRTRRGHRGQGARSTLARAIVQLPGTAAWISASQFHAAAAQSQALRDFIVRYNDVLLAQVQQSVACNALHGLEARLCRWLLQTHDCVDGNVIPLTQELLGQMLEPISPSSR